MPNPACLLLILLLAGAAAAQPGPRVDTDIRFERIDSRDGLSHNSVFSILQDRQGYLWFGTHDGLNRYDGYGFEVYRHRPGDAGSLSGNSVFALAEDAAGALWIGTRGSLDRYDAQTDTFTRHRLPTPADLAVSSIAVDADERLWVGLDADSMVVRFDPRDGMMRRYTLAASGHGAAVVGVDRQGRAWAASRDFAPETRLTVHRLDTASRRFEPLALPGRQATPRVFPVLHRGPTGTLWIGAWDDGWPEAARRALRAIPEVPTFVTALLEDRQERLWIGTGRGLYLHDPATEDTRHFLLDPSGTSWIDNFVRALYQDRAGAVWVGTNSGLYRYDPHRKPFTFLDPAAYADALPKAGPIMALAADGQGGLWVGTLGAGLLHIDPAGRTTRRYPLARAGNAGPGHPASADLIWDVHPEPPKSQTLLLATSAGPARFDVRTGRAVWLNEASVSTVQSGTEPGTLIASGARLLRIDPTSGAVGFLIDPAIQQRLGIDHIEDVRVDPARNALWIAAEAGLFRHDLSANRTAPVAEARAALGSNAPIWSLHRDARGGLWLGTDLGLVRFDPDTRAVTRFDASGWPGSVVYSILEDDQGRLWLGTSHGLVRFDPATGEVRHFDALEGIGNTEFNRRAARRLPDGRMAFGGLDGITLFDPAAVDDNPYMPPVVVTRMHRSSQDGTVSVRPAPERPVQLTFHDKAFGFEFAALNFTNPEKNRYRYRLEGFEAAWVEAGVRRRADYTNIPPGAYVFRVQGANNDGLWNEQGAALPVVVHPPYWRTWWFRALVVAAVLALLVAGYRYRVARLLEIERLRLRIAGDLHDDIGSKLSGMALMSELLEADPAVPARLKTDLAEIGASAREIIGDLRDIVWFVDPDHDQAGKTVEKMRQTARRLLNGAAYTFDVVGEEALERADMTLRRNVFLIYKEALHNVARHADASTVQIHLRVEAGALALTIIDDGVGFAPGEADAGSGLKNMHRRAREIGGTLKLTSEAGRGVRVEFNVPVN